MILTDFVSKYLGKTIDLDGAYGGQCVDLARFYWKEVCGISQPKGVTGAKDFWTNFETDSNLNQNFTKVLNTPDGVPESGDVMIWGAKYGPYGHIAIVTEANTKTFTCFSQNDPVGTPCSIKTYSNWTQILGWFHPIKESNSYRGYDLNNTDSMKVAVDKLCDILDGKYISIDDHNKIINELDAKSTLSAQTYEKEKQTLQEKIRTLEEIIKQLQEVEHSWSDTADIYERKLSAILGELQKDGVSVSIENDESALANTLSLYISNLKNQSKDVLALQQALTTANKKIETLSKKESAFRTVNLGNIIIKFYKR